MLWPIYKSAPRFNTWYRCARGSWPVIEKLCETYAYKMLFEQLSPEEQKVERKPWVIIRCVFGCNSYSWYRYSILHIDIYSKSPCWAKLCQEVQQTLLDRSEDVLLRKLFQIYLTKLTWRSDKPWHTPAHRHNAINTRKYYTTKGIESVR